MNQSKEISKIRILEISPSESEEYIIEEFRGLEEEECKKFEELRVKLESKIENFGIYKTEVEGTIRSEFEGRYDEVNKRLYKRDIQGGDELSERIKGILELRGLFDGYENNKSAIDKYGKGMQFIKDGTWKEWD